MNSLFRRIFLSFWAGFVLILLAGVGVTLAVTSARLDALDGVSSGQLTAAARQAAGGGSAALARWASEAEEAYPTLRIFVLDRAARELRGASLPIRLRDWVALNFARTVAHWDAGQAGATHMPDSWWSVPGVQAGDGSTYFLMFLPYDSSAYEVLGVPYVMALLALCAVLVSGVACWVISRHIAAPVLGVQAGLRALARGDLGTRLGPALARRRDELGRLAGDFDTTAQRLQELVSAQEMLLRDVSHELRSPLTRLRLALDLARRGGPGRGAQLDRIERECERLDALTGQVLRLARLRAPAPVEHGPVDLLQLVDACVADVAYEAQAQGRSVAWQPPQSVAVPVAGAADELASMLENVVRNALRFTPADGQVEVVLQPLDAQVRVSVRDRGPGIPAGHLEQVFAPFFQSDSSRAGGHTGVGLGLSIAQTVARRHGGDILLSNRPGGGLCVDITLPRAPAGPGGCVG